MTWPPEALRAARRCGDEKAIGHCQAGAQPPGENWPRNWRQRKQLPPGRSSRSACNQARRRGIGRPRRKSSAAGADGEGNESEVWPCLCNVEKAHGWRRIIAEIEKFRM